MSTARSNHNHSYCFESYGVLVRLESNSREVLDQAVLTARSALLEQTVEIPCSRAEQTFSLQVGPGGKCGIIQNGEVIITGETDFKFWKFFDSLVRILIADFASSVVFLHAGVVGWRGKALVLPGNSFFGKTTLVAALVRAGAEYYSDEYAVLDGQGLVQPFARALSLRTDGASVVESRVRIESLGGIAGNKPIPIGCVLFTRYEPESVPNYRFLSAGQGIVEVIGQTIAIKRNTEFALKVLKKAFSNAIIVKSPRPDAAKFADVFLEFVDNTAY